MKSEQGPRSERRWAWCESGDARSDKRGVKEEARRGKEEGHGVKEEGRGVKEEE